MIRRTIISLLILPVLFGCSSSTGDRSLNEQRRLINEASNTANRLLTDQEFPELQRYMRSAYAVLIVPNLYKGAFIVGGETGRAVLIVKNGSGNSMVAPAPTTPVTVEPLTTDANGNKSWSSPESMGGTSVAAQSVAMQTTGGWGNPVFYRVSGGSLGLQIGAQSSEVIITIMTQKGLDSLLNNSVKLGADVSIAVGPVGKGISAQTAPSRNADMYAFSRAAGLYGGVSLSGAAVQEDTEWNVLVYGRQAQPRDIMKRNDSPLEEAEYLRRTLNR